MEASVIAELVTGVGFPIAIVIVLLWFIFKLQNESVTREEKLYSVIATFGEKLSEIGNALTKVVDNLAALTNRVGEIENKLDKE